MGYSDMLGLYRRYDGEYFFVSDVIEYFTQECVVAQNIKSPKYKVVIPIKEFFGDEYEVKVIEDGNIREEVKKVKDHPDNKVMQERMFMLVKDVENVVTSFSDLQLMKELSSRDTILQDLDIEGLSEKVYSSEIVVGEKYEECLKYGEIVPKGVIAKYLCRDLKEAVKCLEKENNKRFAVFRRSWVEIDKKDLIECLQGE